MDVDESTVADTDVSTQIIDLVKGAGRSADSELSIVVVGGNTVGANSFDREEISKAGTDSINVFFIEFADNRRRCGRLWRRDVG